MAAVIVTAVVVAVAVATVATTVNGGTAVAYEKQRRKKTTEDIETSTVAGRKRNTGIGTHPSTATTRRKNTATDTQPNTATIRRRNNATGTQPNATASNRCSSSSNYRYTESGGLVCDMECMIIGSFGDKLPSGVEVVRKASTKGGSFLPGVRKDLRTIQSLIRNDPTKTLTYVHTDFPGKGCLRPKEEYLQDIEDFLQGCKTPGGELSLS